MEIIDQLNRKKTTRDEIIANLRTLDREATEHLGDHSLVIDGEVFRLSVGCGTWIVRRRACEIGYHRCTGTGYEVIDPYDRDVNGAISTISVCDPCLTARIEEI